VSTILQQGKVGRQQTLTRSTSTFHRLVRNPNARGLSIVRVKVPRVMLSKKRVLSMDPYHIFRICFGRVGLASVKQLFQELFLGLPPAEDPDTSHR
jgi:uncharacterized protein (DUF302 family)